MKSESKSKPVTIKATILNTIKESKRGITTKGIRKRTGFSAKQVSDNVFHLKKDGLAKVTKSGRIASI